MRYWFLAATVCALAVAVCAGEDLLAKCRCQISARRAAKCERKAARRGFLPTDNRQPTTDNPYDGVQPLGASASLETELVWQCHQGRCRLVRVPVARQAQPIPPKPQPDPAFKAVAPNPPATPPPTPEAKTEASVTVPAPEVNMLAGSDVPRFDD